MAIGTSLCYSRFSNLLRLFNFPPGIAISIPAYFLLVSRLREPWMDYVHEHGS